MAAWQNAHLLSKIALPLLMGVPELDVLLELEEARPELEVLLPELDELLPELEDELASSPPQPLNSSAQSPPMRNCLIGLLGFMVFAFL